ncbi:amino acid ABC transporter substrate-binding protein [Campylobacter sp. faydin G-24]|uniref:Amino acid ABC transporter substrate-binding protein n=1 Tax=Campylobacter anatolicus TaxID=2829105 RepID=A0ABS5HIT5_9BACT|nr:amino acid ABC transporter substrate-binding protein [Campylobacter anatolicus]MBR8464175.1 amino acid ABC transporter substrate-binding protein [Campylobacter anatolicus]
MSVKKLFLPLFGLAFLASAYASDTLRIATEGTYSPYSYHNEKNELVGYDVDVARAVAQKMGVKAEFVEAPWDAMLAAFNAQKADVVFNQVSITEDRKLKYDYTIPYTTAYGVIVVRKDNDIIKSFEDLKGKNSAHSATSNWAKMAESYGANVVVTDGFSKGIELIIAKRADTTINDSVTFFDYIKQRPNAPIKIAATSKETIYSAAIVHKGDKKLLNAINKALKELKDEGKLKEISVKYFGEDISE